MKKLFGLFLLAAGSVGWAADNGIDELAAPMSPAFSLLGIAPTTIERPATPRAFGVALLGGAANGDTSLPKNLAIEAAPFWWVDHPDLETITQKNGARKFYEPSVGQNILQTLSVSIATSDATETVAGIENKATNLGVGLRFQIFSGQRSDDFVAAVDDLLALQMQVLQGQIPINSPALKAAGQKVGDLEKPAHRVGWALEVASAVTWHYPDGKTSERQRDRTGVWATLSYRTPKANDSLSNLRFSSAVRYIDDRRKGDHYVDVGAKLDWTPSRLPVVLSAEYFSRSTKADSTERYAVALEYLYSADWSLVASFGKNFSTDLIDGEDLTTVLGVKLGIGKGYSPRTQ